NFPECYVEWEVEWEVENVAPTSLAICETFGSSTVHPMKSLSHRFILLLIQEAEEKQVRELLNHVHWLSRGSTRCASEAGG
ncbi:hypothetical protein JY505_07120, partial [Corynebacterium amycolatum]|nr:hypothetical protein [Corynebacterium amycolatum]